MSACTHDLTEREVACAADGMCPMCLAARIRELEADLARVTEERDKARREALEEARQLCAQQAEDDGLWFVAQTCSEAYLQQGLRALHALIEEPKP